MSSGAWAASSAATSSSSLTWTCLNSMPFPAQSSSTAVVFRNRLLAYGSGSCVVVEDVRSKDSLAGWGGGGRRTILSTAHHVRGSVSALSFHPGVQSTSIYLSSGDSLGRVVVWDVSMGCPVACLAPKDYLGAAGLPTTPAAVVSLSYVTASYLLAILLQGGTIVLYDVKRRQPVYLKQLGEEYTMMRTNGADARQVILANEKTGVFTNLTIRSLRSEKQITYKRFQIGDGSLQLYDVRWAGGRRFETIVLVLLEREMIVFDVGYGTNLWSGGVRGGLSGLRRVVSLDWGVGRGGDARGGGEVEATQGMPTRVVVRHVGGEVSVWRLRGDTGYGLAGSWSTKDVGGVAYLEGLGVDRSRDDGHDGEGGETTAFVGVNASGDSIFRWDVRLGAPSDAQDGRADLPAYLREMRQGLSGRVLSIEASIRGSGCIAVGTERGFVEVYAGGDGGDGDDGGDGAVAATRACVLAPTQLQRKILVTDSMMLSGVAWLGKHATCRKVVAYASQQEGGAHYRNVVKVVDIVSGRVETVKNARDDGMIREVKVSCTGAYMLIVCTGMPNELWWTGGPGGEGQACMDSGSSMHDGKQLIQRLRQLDLDFTSVSWIDSGRHGNDASTIERAIEQGSDMVPPPEEMFAFSLSDARLGILLVKGRKIQDTRPVPPSWAPLLTGEFRVTSCAPAKHHLFLGSSDGTLARWDTTTGATVAVETGCRRISKVATFMLPSTEGEADPPSSTLVALLSSSGTFAVLVVDADGKFTTSKISWTTGVSSVGYARDVSFYSSEVLLVESREGCVYMVNIEAVGDVAWCGGARHQVVAPGIRRLVAAMIQGGLDVESVERVETVDSDHASRKFNLNLDDDALWEYLPVSRGESSPWDAGLPDEDAEKTSPDPRGAGFSPAFASVARASPEMADLISARATRPAEDADSPLYSPTGRGSTDRAAFQSSLGISTDPSHGTTNQHKSRKSQSMTSKVLKSISSLARDKSPSSSPKDGSGTSNNPLAALASAVLVPQSPAAMCSPRHGLNSSRALIGMSLADAVRLVGASEGAWNITPDFGADDSPARRMAIAARIQWNDEEYCFWKELHEHLYTEKRRGDTGWSTIQDPGAHIKALAELSKWHANTVLEQRDIVEKAVIELICLDDVNAAVSLLLTSPPEATQTPGSNAAFYRDALCALGLAYSTLTEENSLFAQAARVIAINASTGLGDSLISIPLLYATGKYPEVVETLQSNDMWLCAAALAASRLKDRPSELNTALLAFAEHVAFRRGAVWAAVGMLIGGSMYDQAVQLLTDLNMTAEAYGLAVTLLDAGGDRPEALLAPQRFSGVVASYKKYVSALAAQQLSL